MVNLGKKQRQPLRTPGLAAEGAFTRPSSTLGNLGVFKNNPSRDHFLTQDSGYLSTALEEEGTCSDLLTEDSFDQLLGTCSFLVQTLELHQY